jgi:hypothetical protein
MTLEQISDLSQAIAAAAVVISLFILVRESRQSNQLARDAAIRNQLEGMQNISRVIFETPGMAEVWIKGSAALDQCSDGDRIRYLTFLTYSFRVWEGLHAQFIRGNLQEPLWLSHTQMLRDVQALPGAKEMWGMRKHIFSPAFQEFYERNLSQGEVRDIYGLSAMRGST